LVAQRIVIAPLAELDGFVSASGYFADVKNPEPAIVAFVDSPDFNG